MPFCVCASCFPPPSHGRRAASQLHSKTVNELCVQERWPVKKSFGGKGNTRVPFPVNDKPLAQALTSPDLSLSNQDRNLAPD